MNAAAGTRARFEHRDVVTELSEFVSSNKPGQSGSEYEHLPGRAFQDFRRYAATEWTANETGAGCSNCAAPQKLTAS